MPLREGKEGIFLPTLSLEYLLRTNFSKIDSQHFWDAMDAFPVEAIESAEDAILQKEARISKNAWIFAKSDWLLLWPKTIWFPCSTIPMKGTWTMPKCSEKSDRENKEQIRSNWSRHKEPYYCFWPWKLKEGQIMDSLSLSTHLRIWRINGTCLLLRDIIGRIKK